CLGFAATSRTTNQTTVAQFRDFLNVTGATVGTQPTGTEPLGPCTRKTGHVISEIMWKPAPRADAKNLEFIEIFNSNPLLDDLSGYRIARDINFTFPANTILNGGAFLVVAAVPRAAWKRFGPAPCAQLLSMSSWPGQITRCSLSWSFTIIAQCRWICRAAC